MDHRSKVHMRWLALLVCAGLAWVSSGFRTCPRPHSPHSPRRLPGHEWRRVSRARPRTAAKAPRTGRGRRYAHARARSRSRTNTHAYAHITGVPHHSHLRGTHSPTYLLTYLPTCLSTYLPTYLPPAASPPSAESRTEPSHSLCPSCPSRRSCRCGDHNPSLPWWDWLASEY